MNHPTLMCVVQRVCQRDAQLRSLLLLETEVEQNKLVPLLFYDGLPINARGIVEAINQDQTRTTVKPKSKEAAA